MTRLQCHEDQPRLVSHSLIRCELSWVVRMAKKKKKSPINGISTANREGSTLGTKPGRINRKKKVRASRNVDGFDADTFAKGVLADLRFSRTDHIVTLFVPSHDRNQNALGDGVQSQWANAAMERLADLFQGATAMMSHAGIYKSRRNHYLWDNTIVIQSFAKKSQLEDEKTLRALGEFAGQMKRSLSQEAVLIAFDNLVRFVV